MLQYTEFTVVHYLYDTAHLNCFSTVVFLVSYLYLCLRLVICRLHFCLCVHARDYCSCLRCHVRNQSISGMNKLSLSDLMPLN